MALNEYGRNRGEDLLSLLQTHYDLENRGLTEALQDLLVDACRAAEVRSENVHLERTARKARKIYTEMG